MIRAYWRDRGFDVKVWLVIGERENGRRALRGIRSSLVAGMPPELGGRWVIQKRRGKAESRGRSSR